MNKEKGTRFGFITLEDLTGTVEVACWAGRAGQGNRPAQRGYGRLGAVSLKGDEPLLVHGEVKVNSRDEENPRAELTAIDDRAALAGPHARRPPRSPCASTPTGSTEERAAAVKALLARHPGGCALSVRAVIPLETETTITVPQKVAPADELIESARRLGFEVELR